MTDEDKLEKLEAWLTDANARYDDYHAHKEIITHAIVTLEVALFGYLATAENVVPTWYCSLSDRCIAWLGITTVFSLFVAIHWLLLFQLRMRNIASAWSAAAGIAFARWLNAPPSGIALTPAQPAIARESVSTVRQMIDQFVFPMFRLAPSSDSDRIVRELPRCFKEILAEQERGPDNIQRLLAIVSIWLLLASASILAYRIEMSC